MGDSVWEAQQCTEGTHQWVPFSLGSHCLLSTWQHNGVAGPLRLILMSYYSSPHYPCYWLVWSQPWVLQSNNKHSSFFSSLFSRLIPLTPTHSESDRADSFLHPPPRIPCAPRSWFIDQSLVNTAEILKSWSGRSHRISRSCSALLAKLVLKQSDH